jgi:5-methylcytosine-specific restriction protein A
VARISRHKKVQNPARWKGVTVKGDFYNSTTWRKMRANYIADNPLCVHCKNKDFIKPATVVDHIIRIKDGGANLDKRNLQSLCAKCHNAKSARERNGSEAQKEYSRNHLGQKIPTL